MNPKSSCGLLLLFSKTTILQQACALALLSSLLPAIKNRSQYGHEGYRPYEKPQLGCPWRILRFLRCANRGMRALYMKTGIAAWHIKAFVLLLPLLLYYRTSCVLLPKQFQIGSMGVRDRDHRIQKRFPRFPSYVGLSAISSHSTKKATRAYNVGSRSPPTFTQK